jgi:hypothetical protein
MDLCHLGVFSILPQGTDEKQPENNMIENCMIQYETKGGRVGARRSKGGETADPAGSADDL